MNHTRLAVVTAALLLFSCTQTRKATAPGCDFEIRFGRTGGFTNIPVEYALFENRKVYRIRGDESVNVNRIRIKEMKEIKNLVDSLGFRNLESEKPGNVNYFIRVCTADSDHRVSWSETGGDNPRNILFRRLLDTLREEP